MTVITDTADTSAVPENETTKRSRKSATAATVDPALVNQLVTQAREQGLQLSGEGGLLQQLTKIVLESALEGEITDHLGYDRHDPAGNGSGNSRNGIRTKTVLTDVGPVQVNVPGTGRVRSRRRSCVSANAACPVWRTWCCRCRRRA